MVYAGWSARSMYSTRTFWTCRQTSVTSTVGWKRSNRKRNRHEAFVIRYFGAVLIEQSDEFMSGQSTDRPFVFSVVEDDGENVIIEISEEDYQRDLAAGIDEDPILKAGAL